MTNEEIQKDLINALAEYNELVMDDGFSNQQNVLSFLIDKVKLYYGEDGLKEAGRIYGDRVDKKKKEE